MFLNNNIILSQKEIIKKYFIQNNIDDFYNNLDDVCTLIENKIDNFKDNDKFKNIDLVLKVYNIFIHDLETYITDFEIERLKNGKAYNYYKNYLEKNAKVTIKKII